MAVTWTRDAPVDPNAAAPPGIIAPPQFHSPQSPPTASTSAQREQIADLLRKLFAYLRDNAPAHQGLATAITEMHSAVAAYQSGQTENPFGPIQKVLQAIETQRKLDPTVPKP